MTNGELMNYSFEKLSVDGGNITAILLSAIPHAKELDLSQYDLVPVKKGKYKLHFRIPDCWDGEILMEAYLKVEKDDVLVLSDCCYWFNAEYDYDWFSEEFDGGANMYGIGLYAGTGGDGSFNVEISLEEVKRAPANKYKKFVKKLEALKKDYEKQYNKKVSKEKQFDHFNILEKYVKETMDSLEKEYGYSRAVQNFYYEIQAKQRKYLSKLMKDIKAETEAIKKSTRK